MGDANVSEGNLKSEGRQFWRIVSGGASPGFDAGAIFASERHGFIRPDMHEDIPQSSGSDSRRQKANC
jgi:hypothetical protein